MFGLNKIEKLDHGNGKSLHVVKGSPFLTIQGEGPYAGHPAVFIRLHGCHLRCTFCDTDFDTSDDPTWITSDLAAKAKEIRKGARLVVITGGEPMRQNILPLCFDLWNNFETIQIETAGTFWLEGIQNYADIVCSPKTPTVHPMIRRHAVAFKYVISGSSKYGGGPLGFVPITATQPGSRPARLAEPSGRIPVYQSPCDEQDEVINKFNREMVAAMAIEYGVIAGLQMHKIFGVD